MPLQVVNGATLQCAGAFPPGLGQFVVLPMHMVTAEDQPAANIMDYVPMENITTFGMCMLPSNPAVAAATAAALGVLTPMPCIPMTASPWTPGAPTVMIQDQPALDNTCTCLCTYGGVITVIDPGQATVMIP